MNTYITIEQAIEAATVRYAVAREIEREIDHAVDIMLTLDKPQIVWFWDGPDYIDIHTLHEGEHIYRMRVDADIAAMPPIMASVNVDLCLRAMGFDVVNAR